MRFLYQGANVPEPSVTLYVDKLRQVSAPVRRRTTTVFGRVYQHGGEICYPRLPCRQVIRIDVIIAWNSAEIDLERLDDV